MVFSPVLWKTVSVDGMKWLLDIAKRVDEPSHPPSDVTREPE
jgi:hypothetical protein